MKHHRDHHHHKHEMEHHKMRAEHKAHHEKKMAEHHSHHKASHEHHNPHMVENRKVGESHKGGIHRVMQRKGDMQIGQHGKMGMHHHGDSFKRADSAKTPRRA